MAKITVPSGGGGGDNFNSQKKFSGPPVTISGTGGTFEPVYVEKITPELTGNTDSITDQCGYTEVRRSGTISNWNVSIEGIVESRDAPTLKTLAESDDTVNVQCSVLGSRGGEFVVDKCTLDHTDDLNRIVIPNRATSDEAYSFKLSLKSPKSAKSSGG